MSTGTCRLCERVADLQLSHVLPAFAYRWLRSSSGNGHIRSLQEPNKRIQDGPKFYWLCAECEGLIGRNETEFTKRLFYPYLKAPGQTIPYSNWLIQFCTSVSWRVLHFYMDEAKLQSWDQTSLSRLAIAEVVWREMLLGKRSNPGAYQQHLLPLDRIDSTSVQFSPNIKRYLMRAIQLDICRGSQSIFTFAKLGRFMIIGFVHEPHPAHWKGTKILAKHGFVEPRNYTVPNALAEYLNNKARKLHEGQAAMSQRQNDKVDASFQANIDRFAESDAFKAMQADVELFGDEAFARRVQNRP